MIISGNQQCLRGLEVMLGQESHRSNNMWIPQAGCAALRRHRQVRESATLKEEATGRWGRLRSISAGGVSPRALLFLSFSGGAPRALVHCPGVPRGWEESDEPKTLGGSKVTPLGSIVPQENTFLPPFHGRPSPPPEKLAVSFFQSCVLKVKTAFGRKQASSF